MKIILQKIEIYILRALALFILIKPQSLSAKTCEISLQDYHQDKKIIVTLNYKECSLDELCNFRSKLDNKSQTVFDIAMNQALNPRGNIISPACEGARCRPCNATGSGHCQGATVLPSTVTVISLTQPTGQTSTPQGATPAAMDYLHSLGSEQYVPDNSRPQVDLEFRYDDSQSIFSSESLQNLVQMGYLMTSLSQLTTDQTLAHAGMAMNTAYSVIFMWQQQTDEIAEAQLAWRRKIYHSVFATAIETVQSAIAATNQLGAQSELAIKLNLDSVAKNILLLDHDFAEIARIVANIRRDQAKVLSSSTKYSS